MLMSLTPVFSSHFVRHEIPGSAVCVFDMQVIREIFNEGQFKTQNSGNWYALPRDMEKKPRPGNVSSSPYQLILTTFLQ